MPEIHVQAGRLYAVASPGLLVRKDELALLEQSDGVAFVLSGTTETGTTPLSMTVENRLRVDASAAANLFDGDPWSGAPNPFSGSCW